MSALPSAVTNPKLVQIGLITLFSAECSFLPLPDQLGYSVLTQSTLNSSGADPVSCIYTTPWTYHVLSETLNTYTVLVCSLTLTQINQSKEETRVPIQKYKPRNMDIIKFQAAQNWPSTGTLNNMERFVVFLQKIAINTASSNYRSLNPVLLPQVPKSTMCSMLRHSKLTLNKIPKS